MTNESQAENEWMIAIKKDQTSPVIAPQWEEEPNICLRQDLLNFEKRMCSTLEDVQYCGGIHTIITLGEGDTISID